MQPHELDHVDTTARTTRWHTIWEYARDPATWILVGSAATAFALGAGFVYLLWWLLSALFTGIGNLGGNAAEAVTDFAEPIIRTITDPVHRYIHNHAEHLPIAANALWWSWLVTTGGLFGLAALGSKGARVGWTALGAATVALVWAGTPTGGQLLAATLTTAVWAVLSLIAFNGIAVEPDTRYVIFRRDPTPDHE